MAVEVAAASPAGVVEPETSSGRGPAAGPTSSWPHNRPGRVTGVSGGGSTPGRSSLARTRSRRPQTARRPPGAEDLEQAPPHLRPQLRLGHVLQHELGLQRPAGLRRDPRASARRDGRRQRDVVRLAQAVRAGQHIPRTPTGCWTASSTSSALMSRKASSPGIPPHRITRLRRQGERYFAHGLRELPDNRRLAISRGLRRRVGGFPRRRGGGDPRPAPSAERIAKPPGSVKRRGPRGAPGIRRTGDGAARRAGHRRGPRRGDRGRSGMGGPRRPGRQGGRVREHGRVGSVESRVGGLQPFPPLHAAHATHAGHRGVADGRALAGRGRRPAQRRHGAADPGSCGRTRGGGGCCAPNPITASGRRRCCSTCETRSAPATSGWRGRAATATSDGAIGSRRL